jgi:exportin-5
MDGESGLQSQITHISNALHATLDPRVPNEVRQQALQHLEAVKSQPDAPQHGFTLAEDWQQNNAVRYYGLQLLEFAIRYRWHEYTDEQALQLRTWVMQLAGNIREQDATFLRNKVGQLWVEVAKRCWGDGEWMDMDALLVDLWEQDNGTVNKVFVLGVLEALSEDIMHNEDAVAGLRLDVLGNALNEIMIPPGMYKQYTLQKGKKQDVRCGEDKNEGWLARTSGFFALCVKEARLQAHQPDVAHAMEMCAIKALNAMRPVMSWISLQGAQEVKCVDCLYLPFLTSNVALQIAAVEVLYSLLGRSYNPHYIEVWTTLLRQAMKPERVQMIRRAFEDSVGGPGDDEDRYVLQKKMAELLSVFAETIAQHTAVVDDSFDLPALFDLLVKVTEHKSLTVSIPVLHSWTKLLAVQVHKVLDLVLSALPTLLEICSERLIRYEALPEDTEDETLQWLAEDFDTIPERHAFLGNYRRYCNTIIQSIARYRPIDALSIVLDGMQQMIENGPYTAGHGFDPSTYNKASLPVLRFDAQYNVVGGTLKGYSAWLSDVEDVTPEQELYWKVEKDRQQAADALQQWCHGMANVHTDDPGVADQVLQTLVQVLRTLKSPSPSFVLAMVQHLLTMRLHDQPQHAMFSEAVKSFEALRVVELQKLALAFPNVLLDVFNELEPRVEELAQKHGDDQRLVWGYRAFLFMIVHRATGLNQELRMARLQSMLAPTYDAWTDPMLQKSVENMHSFCEATSLDNIQDFYKTHGFDRIQDWSSHQLNESGQARQVMIKEKSDRLPLRMTKSMLAATTDRLTRGSSEYESGCALWGSLIPSILPSLLLMIRHAQAFHNMSNWSQLPVELQMVIKRTLQDRFWQSGISNESKDEFYARISGSKSSYEGFASTVRGTMRNVREMAYHIIYLMTKFDDQFYGIDNLAEPLADALFTDAGSLSANHLHPIINLTTGLVQRCPPRYRRSFLPPVLRRLFVTLDAKISAEWQALTQAADQNKKEMDELSDEMRTESVLRQLTYSMVSFVPFLLDYDKSAPPPTNGHQPANGNGTSQQNLGDLVLSDPSLLEPLIMFCTHALRMRDGRCCSTICRVFRQIVPLFAHTTPSPSNPISTETAAQVREFISDEVLKACITSLNEPYFADLQKDLAALIANILALYATKTSTPRDLLLSLPDMSPARIDKALQRVGKMGNERQQRAVVLELLEGVRGVSIHEMGKLEQAKAKKREHSAGRLQQYTMELEPKPGGVRGGDGGGGGDEELDGVAGLFGDV